MEDIFKFLLVIGFIVFGFVKQTRKNSMDEPANEGDVIPMPEESSIPEEILPSQEDENTQPKSACTQQKQNKDFASRKNYVFSKQHKQCASESTQPVVSPTLNDADENTDFCIHSAEEARRAIIWSEILQRKY